MKGLQEVDARVEHLVGIVAALAVAFANRLVEERGILRGVDLHVVAAEPPQFLDFPPREVDEIGQIGVAGRVRAA